MPTFNFNTGVPAFTVFIQGLVSFFSPCVLPLVPMYISYLAGGSSEVGPDGKRIYPKKRVLINTFFFVLGISFTFFLLGLGFSAAGQFFARQRKAMLIIGGIIIILFGLYQLGVFGISSTLSRERKLPFNLDRFAMNPLVALLLGFTFSFGWTPCVGPVLMTVLSMTAAAETKSLGFLLIGLYTLGFVIPFMAVGIFTSQLLNFFKKHQKIVQISVKVGGILMILIGILMVTGLLYDLNRIFASLG